MNISHHIDHATLNVSIDSSFTFEDHHEFRTVLECIEDDQVSLIVFHMDRLNIIDSAALGMMLLALDVGQKTQKRIVISGIQGQVKKMFELTRFDTLFAME